MIQAVNWINPKNTFLPPFCFLAFSAAKLDTLLPKIKWKINMRQGSSFPQVSFNTSFFLKNTSKKLLRKVCSYVLLFFFLLLEIFTSIPYFFQIYCGFSDIRLCKMPCREYCLCHLFFIIFFLSCISFLSDFSSISSDIKLYSFQLFGSISYWLSGRAGRAGRAGRHTPGGPGGPGGPEGKILGSTYVPSNTWSESWPRAKYFHFSPDLTQPV